MEAGGRHRGRALLEVTMDRVRELLSGTLDKIIDRRSLRLGFWLNLLLTLACVHSLIFGDLHMDVGSS